MANFRCKIRTNAFMVKDIEAFKAELQFLTEDGSLEIVEETLELDGQERPVVTLLWENANGSEFPSIDPRYPAEDEVSFDIQELIQQHLCDDSVAIMLTVGSEKLCYFVGEAVAFNNQGHTHKISLSSIHGLAQELTHNPKLVTVPEY